MLSPLPIKFGPLLRADLPLFLFTDEGELFLLFTHEHSRPRRLPALTERCDGMAAVERIDANVLDVANDEPSIPRIILRSGGAHTGARDTPPFEIPAQLRRVEILDLAAVRTLFRIGPFKQAGTGGPAGPYQPREARLQSRSGVVP